MKAIRVQKAVTESMYFSGWRTAVILKALVCLNVNVVASLSVLKVL